ncbi:MAG: EamA family transporter [Terriglobia bacterium]|jgi:drug/metabolite transporter (DMT)-like permease|nr:EamA family transporter [Terriglobia bacterium]
MSVISNSAARSRAGDSRFLVLLAFATIYLVWGSTYLAIRYAVETIPPLITAGLRHLTAGSVLFAWAWFRGFRPTRREWLSTIVLAFLFFLIGHGSLHWAEQVVPSGLAALLVATEPLFLTLFALMLSARQNLNLPNIAGLAIGFIGVILLTTDSSALGQHRSLIGVAVLIAGTIAWSIGMLYSKQSKSLPADSLARAAMSMLLGSWMLLAAAGFSGEFRGFHWSTVSGKSFFGLLYLIVFGSMIAFTAYMWLLERSSPTLVATHTYVNPVVAVFLGWALAGETMTGRTLIASALVVASVICVSFGHSEERQRITGKLDEEAA